MARVYLVEATPWDIAGNAVNVYLAGGGSRGYNHRGRSTWKGGLVREPKFSAVIGFDQSGWTGGALSQTARVPFFPAEKAVLTDIMSRQWANAPVEVLVGDDATAAPVWTTLIKGTVVSVRVVGGAVEFTIADAAGKKLADPYLTARFAGTGGIEGDVEVEGRIKRRSHGKVFNVEGFSLLKAYNIFEFGDPARPIYAFTSVRDKGRVAGPAAPVVLPWQGSIAATLAALMAATPTSGSCVVAPSICCVKWWTRPSGPLTADIQGEVGAGYVATATAIAGVIAAANGIVVNAISAAVQATKAATGEAGVHIGDTNETIANVLDRLILGAGILWVLDAGGNMSLFDPLTASGDDVTIAGEISRIEVYRPVTARRMAYQRSYRKHNDGEISVAVQNVDIEGLGGLALKNYAILGSDVVQSNGTTQVTDAAVLNSYLSISAGGAFSGGAGGQVTPVGLEAASGVVIRNNQISITSGSLNGIGTGNATAVANNLLSMGANGVFSGGAGGQVTILGLGFTGSLNATTNLRLFKIGTGTIAMEGNSVQLNVPSGESTDGFNSENIFPTPFQILFRHNAVGSIVVGLIADKTLSSWPGNFSWAIRVADGTATIMLPGGDPNVQFTYVAGDQIEMTHDKRKLYYKKNGQTQYSFAASFGTTPVYLRGIFNGQAGTKVYDLVFQPYAILPAAGYTLEDSAGGLLADSNIKNSFLSISAGGAFSGGGGGQVTPVGLEGSSGLVIRNNQISITSGSLNGIGTGNATAVANSLMSIGANGVFSGGAGGQVTLAGIDTVGVIGRTTLLSSTTGRVVNPTFYNTQALLGIPSTTNLTATYAASGSNWLVTLPAHTRKVAGVSGPVTLSYGSTSGVVAPSAAWWAYYLDPNLTGLATPSVTFTANPDDLLQAGAYRVAFDYAPATGTSNPPPPDSGGGGTFRNGQWVLETYQ